MIGRRFAIFFLAEFMNVITMCAIATTLFLGGPSGPALWPSTIGGNGVINVWLMPIFWFMIKTIALTYGTVWLRAATPRMRYDKLMAFCWKYLIEAAILWIMFEIALEIGSSAGWTRTAKFALAGGTALACGALYSVLMLCVPKPGETIEEFR